MERSTRSFNFGAYHTLEAVGPPHREQRTGEQEPERGGAKAGSLALVPTVLLNL